MFTPCVSSCFSCLHPHWNSKTGIWTYLETDTTFAEVLFSKFCISDDISFLSLNRA